MLFKTLGYLTSFGNIAILSATYHNNILVNFGSPHWNIAFGGMLFLSITSIVFFYLNNQKEGYSALKLYGGIYVFITSLIYGYWSIKTLYLETSFKEFQGFFLLYLTLMLISFLSIGIYQKRVNGKLLILFSNLLSILTIIVSFAMIYKYVFLQMPLDFENLVLELFTIFIGSISFLSAYFYGERRA